MKALMLVLAVVLVGGCASTSISPKQKAIVEKAIRKELNKPTGELTEANLQQLTRLNLERTKITDASLKEIAKLQKLMVLDLYNTKITDAGAAELRKALPKCRISHSYKKD